MDFTIVSAMGNRTSTCLMYGSSYGGGLHGRIFLKINTSFNPLMPDIN